MEAFAAIRYCTVYTVNADLRLNFELKELGHFSLTVSFFTVNRTPLKTGVLKGVLAETRTQLAEKKKTPAALKCNFCLA